MTYDLLKRAWYLRCLFFERQDSCHFIYLFFHSHVVGFLLQFSFFSSVTQVPCSINLTANLYRIDCFACFLRELGASKLTGVKLNFLSYGVRDFRRSNAFFPFLSPIEKRISSSADFRFDRTVVSQKVPTTPNNSIRKSSLTFTNVAYSIFFIFF